MAGLWQVLETLGKGFYTVPITVSGPVTMWEGFLVPWSP